MKLSRLVIHLLILQSPFFSNSLWSEERVFHDAFVVIPDESNYRQAFPELLDPRTRFVRSSRDFGIRYDELPALTDKQLHLLFFKVPLDVASRSIARQRQQRAVENFLRLPVPQIAGLLTNPELRLLESLRSSPHLTNHTQLQLAQSYATHLAIADPAKFLKVVEYLLVRAEEEELFKNLMGVFELIRADRLFGHPRSQDRFPTGFNRNQLQRLAQDLTESAFEGQKLGKELILSRLEQASSFVSKLDGEERAKFNEYRLSLQSRRQNMEQASLIELSTTGYRSSGSTYAKLRDGEYILLRKEDLETSRLQILSASASAVALILRSETHLLALVLDSELDAEESVLRVLFRIGMRKIELKDLKAMLIPGNSARAQELSWRLQSFFSEFKIPYQVARLKQSASAEMKAVQLFVTSERTVGISGNQISNRVRTYPLQSSGPLLQPHPRSLDHSTHAPELRIPIPEELKASFSSLAADGKIGKEELYRLPLASLRKIFNPSDTISEIHHEELASILLSLPYWMIGEIFTQSIPPERLKTYVERLLVDEPQKLEESLLYMAPDAKLFPRLKDYKFIAQIFNSIRAEEAEDFLTHLDQKVAPAFQDYSDALRAAFAPESLDESVETEAEADASAFEVGEKLDVKTADFRSIPKAANFSYIPLLLAGSWKFSSATISGNERAQMKAIVERDSIVVSASDQSGKKIAGLHLKASFQRLEVHHMIDLFIQSLTEDANFDIEATNIDILIGNQKAIVAAGSRSTLDRIQKRFFLHRFASISTRDLNLPEKKDSLAVLLKPLEREVSRLRRPRLLELKGASQLDREPRLSTREFQTHPAIEEARHHQEGKYSHRYGRGCERLLYNIAVKKSSKGKARK